MKSSDENAPASRFRTTQWSLIAAAQEGTSPQAQAALASLCEAYWYPLYAFIRRQGYAIEDARDLTQEFFARLLEKDYLGAAGRWCYCKTCSPNSVPSRKRPARDRSSISSRFSWQGSARRSATPR